MKHRTSAVVALIVILVPPSTCGQAPTPAGSPDVNPPNGAKRVLQAFAQGDQIYTCKEENGQYSWALKAPDARLSDKHGKLLGRHFAGPSWELNDKSAVTGKRIKSVDSPYKDAIPWLLLEVTDHSGNGLLSKVSYIQRLDTKGGKAPATGCDAPQGKKSMFPTPRDMFSTKPSRQSEMPSVLEFPAN